LPPDHDVVDTKAWPACQPPAPLPAAKVTDMHCHTAGLGAGGSGCFVDSPVEAGPEQRFNHPLAGGMIGDGAVEGEGEHAAPCSGVHVGGHFGSAVFKQVQASARPNAE
jgi:hypothetical protein